MKSNYFMSTLVIRLVMGVILWQKTPILPEHRPIIVAVLWTEAQTFGWASVLWELVKSLLTNLGEWVKDPEGGPARTQRRAADIQHMVWSVVHPNDE